jgi:multimeric flavodoxin WrbA
MNDYKISNYCLIINQEGMNKMKKVIAIIGSERKKTTYQAILEFEKKLKLYGDIDFEYAFLNDYNLEFCHGCKLCFDKGEQFCPIRDDRDVLLHKLELTDGVILATPSYAFQVSARMKNFLDRIAFIFHRPRFFGKTFTTVVTQGITGGGKITKYLESSGANMGFHVTRGCCVNTLEPMTELQNNKMKLEMEKCAERFYKGLMLGSPQVPSFSRLMMFRMSRSGIKSAKVKLFDYDYYMDKGWFESDYYYDTKLGPFKKLLGRFFDYIGRQLFK